MDLDPIHIGLPKGNRKDFYYYLIQASWPSLLFLLFCIYVLSNIIFAALYHFGPGDLQNQEGHAFLDAFFFSVQTLSTIGYGNLLPVGVYSNVIVSLEVAYGLIAVAVVTGMIFAKLSRPRANIMFSSSVVHANFNGDYCLSFRIGNARRTDIVEARTRVSALIDEVTEEGEHIRRIHDLQLLRQETPFFRMTWSLYHVIDDTSPLNGLDLTSNAYLKAIVVTVTGHDEAYSSKVHARHTYSTEDIIKDKYFMDIMHESDTGQTVIDYEKFHQLKDG